MKAMEQDNGSPASAMHENNDQNDVFSWLFDTEKEQHLQHEQESLSSEIQPSKKRRVKNVEEERNTTTATMSPSPSTIFPAPPVLGYPSYRSFPPNFIQGMVPFGSTVEMSANEVLRAKSKEEVDNRKKRLEKNRQSARLCRLRKKNQVNELQQRVVQLERENMDLRLKLEEQAKTRASEAEEKNTLTKQLVDLLETSGKDEELSKVMQTFADLYADYGRDRRVALKYHLGQVRRFMMPTQVTKMALWSLQQDDDFYAYKVDENGRAETLWDIISRDMHVTEDQKQKLMEFRPYFKELRDDMNHCASSIVQLEKALEVKNTKIEQAIHKLTTVVSPKQAALFIQWVTNNQACIHMLDKLWQYS